MSKKKKKGKKIRVELRKNVQKRSRTKNFTREVLGAGIELADLESGERVSGKGRLTRRRTIIGIESEEGDELLREVDESKCLTGRVLSAVGLNSFVETDDGKRYACTVRHIVRKLARDERSAVVAGDRVLFLPQDDEYGVIERVEPRHSTLSRTARGKEHVLVSNVDRLLIVVSAAEPPLKVNLVDRFLISAEKGDVSSILCINKIDLVDLVSLQPIVGLYGRLGYDVVTTSAITGFGIERLKWLLKDHETVLAGQSGVGKSSLLNALNPGWGIRTSEVSDWTKKGKHTTRRAELRELDYGGWVIDTPGIRQMKLWDVIPEEVEGFFIEFHPFVALCKFPDCSHTHEKNCGVKRAVEQDLISSARYQSYCKIISDNDS